MRRFQALLHKTIRMRRRDCFLICIALFLFGHAYATDSFYRVDSIQKLQLYFSSNNWDFMLDTAKEGSSTYLLADSIIINGTKLDSAGVKYKGNSSFDPSFAKNPFNISLSEFKAQSYNGFNKIKLANCYRDPSMIRDILAYEIVGNYMHCSRANFAEIYVNDTLLGLYSNTEPINKTFCKNRFQATNGAFVECSPLIRPSPATKCNLRYKDEDTLSYSNFYEMKSQNGWEQFIEICRVIKEEPNNVGKILNIDAFTWMLALNNVLVNLDSYSGVFCQNYLLYKDNSGRYNPIMWDFNLSFGGFPFAGSGSNSMGSLTIEELKYLAPTYHFGDAEWPLINLIIKDDLLKKRYYAHVRTILEDYFYNDYYLERSEYFQELIHYQVERDTNKFFSNEAFQTSLDSNMNVGSYEVPGIAELMKHRITYLSELPELKAIPPIISKCSAHQNSVFFGELATFTIEASNADEVYFAYRCSESDVFTPVLLHDNGSANDSVAGDGVYHCKVEAIGTQMQYYVYAVNSNCYKSLPENAEFKFFSLSVEGFRKAQPGDVIINEFLANNNRFMTNEYLYYSDCIELKNTTNQYLDISDLYLSDDTLDLFDSRLNAVPYIAPNAYILVWADNMQANSTYNHAGFTLSKEGESIILANSEGEIYDSIQYPPQFTDYSMARIPDGTGPFLFKPSTLGICNTCTYISSIDTENEMQVYPTLVNYSFTIKTTSHANKSFRVYDMHGVCVHAGTVCENIQVNCDTWQSGYYFVKVDGCDSYASVYVN